MPLRQRSSRTGKTPKDVFRRGAIHLWLSERVARLKERAKLARNN
jgi:hypothetical protein